MTDLDTAVAWVSFCRYWLVQGVGLLSFIGVNIILAKKFIVKYWPNQTFGVFVVGIYLLSVLGGSMMWYLMLPRPGLLWLPLGLLLVLTIQ